jgi:hypothetical protein
MITLPADESDAQACMPGVAITHLLWNAVAPWRPVFAAQAAVMAHTHFKESTPPA